MARLFFIVGVRRSGTSILRKLLLKHSEVRDIEFEPHPLWFATMMQHFDRFNGVGYCNRVVESFKGNGQKRWYGAKFALNPGIDALDWVWLDDVFGKPKFIFIRRRLIDSYRSYRNVDKDIRRGAINEESYVPAFAFVQKTFDRFVCENPGRSCMISFEELVKNPDRELSKATGLLNIPPLKGMLKLIEKPKYWSAK